MFCLGHGKLIIEKKVEEVDCKEEIHATVADNEFRNSYLLSGLMDTGKIIS